MKKLVAILAVALLACGGAAGYLWQQLDELHSENADLQARLSTAEAMQQALATRLATQTPPAGNDGTPQSATPAAATASAGNARQSSPGQGRPGAGGLLAGAREILSSPEGRELVQPALRGAIQQRFKGIGKALNLSPEEEEKLLDTLARQQMDLSSASMDMLSGAAGDASAMQDAQRRLQEKQRANEAELSAMLGSKYPQFEEYQSTMAARTQVDQLQTALDASGTKLSDAQSKALITALAAEQKRITEETNANPVPTGSNRQETLDLQLQRTVDNNRRLVNAASGYLNAQQLDSYRKMLDQQTALIKRVLGAMGGTGAPPARNGTATP